MTVVPRSEHLDRLEEHLARACRGVYLAQCRAEFEGLEGAAGDLAAMHEHLILLLNESAACSPGARRRLRSARAA